MAMGAGRRKSRTVAGIRLSRAEIEEGKRLVDVWTGRTVGMPCTRADCEDTPRPCPWVSCRHHLYLDEGRTGGSVKLNFPDLEPGDMVASCALDIADSGPMTLEEVGCAMNLTRERVRQIEVQAMERVLHAMGESWKGPPDDE